tara:strand:- start:1671 stop:2120 length:450 start_codon:yes stop_codon:yes gene_type:complete
MKLKIESNISFMKLLKFVHSPRFSNEVVDRIVDPLIEDSKKAIIDGKITPALRPSTIAARKSRLSPKSIGGTKPLYDTGALYKSIEESDKNNAYNFGEGQGFGIQFLEYGLKHITGEGVPKRNFIKLDPKSSLKISKDIVKDFRKALRK